ncbi:MAG: ABC transporter substrate-binding protein [Synergistes sp.]|nr:ABC transporter substrate-binding protein [Synergistes sp.]
MDKRKNFFVTLVLTFALAAFSLSDAAAAHASRIITGHDGDKVTIPDKIDRIAVLSILPFPSVIASYLGSAHKIVGIHPASMGAAKSGLLGELFPEILKAKTSFIKGQDLNIEELMLLKPDIVFYNMGDDAMAQMLHSAKIPAIAVSATKWNYDILLTYEEWTKLLARIFPEKSDKSRKVSDYSKKIYSMIRQRTSKLKDNERKKIFFVFMNDRRKIVTSGKLFFGQYWADAIGAYNSAENLAAENLNAVVTMEQIYAWNPDVIFITNFTTVLPGDLIGNKIQGQDWTKVKAVKNKAVYKMPLGSYRTFTPGVDTPITLLWFAKMTYPKLFKDVDIYKETRDYYKKVLGITLTDKQIRGIFNGTRDSANGYTIQ